jgi:hypothetical protein
MAKLRFDLNTGNAEWEGTPQELLEIYDALKQRDEPKHQVIISVPQVDDKIPIPDSIRMQITKVSDEQELSKRMPTKEQLMFYILGKQKFEHDIVEVEKKFFGKQINSRKYGKLYRELRTRLEAARKSIEASNSGAFERKPTPYRNLPSYTFKKINATPIDTTLQKT